MTQCDPHPYNNATSSEFRVTPYKTGHRAILAMRYQNEADVPATAVVFGLVSGGKLLGLGEDDGRFARDAVIDHVVFLSQQIFPLGLQTHCVVLRVKYANGMAWFNPEPPIFKPRFGGSNVFEYLVILHWRDRQRIRELTSFSPD